MNGCENRKKDRESGEIMIEAAIIFVPVLILLMALLSLSFWFYQEALMNSIAEEIAEEVASNVKFTDLAVNSAPTLDDIRSKPMFRTSFRVNTISNLQKDRAVAYAKWRIPISTLALSSKEAEVECTVKMSGIGRSYVVVRVRQKAEIFLDGILKLEGILDEDSMYGATAYAECVDLMGYTSMINFVDYASGELDSTFGAVGHLYSAVKNLLTTAGF